MSESDDLLGSALTIKQGETFDHAEHGQVEVTGIWRGIKQIDEARHTDEENVYIVRYSAEIKGEQVDGLTDTLDGFLEAIK